MEENDNNSFPILDLDTVRNREAARTGQNPTKTSEASNNDDDHNESFKNSEQKIDDYRKQLEQELDKELQENPINVNDLLPDSEQEDNDDKYDMTPEEIASTIPKIEKEVSRLANNNTTLTDSGQNISTTKKPHKVPQEKTTSKTIEGTPHKNQKYSYINEETPNYEEEDDEIGEGINDNENFLNILYEKRTPEPRKSWLDRIKDFFKSIINGTKKLFGLDDKTTGIPSGISPPKKPPLTHTNDSEPLENAERSKENNLVNILTKPETKDLVSQATGHVVSNPKVPIIRHQAQKKETEQTRTSRTLR